MNRQLKGLNQVDARERQALEVKALREIRVRQRAGHDHMPALQLELKPRGRAAVPHKAMGRYRDPLRTPEERLPKEPETLPSARPLRDVLQEAARPGTQVPDVSSAFIDAARDGRGDGEAGGETDGGAGAGGAKKISRASRRSERDQERGRDKGDFERER